MFRFYIFLCAVLAGAPAMSQSNLAVQNMDFLRPADVFRLNTFDNAFGLSMRRAYAFGSDSDLSVLTEAMRGAPIDADPSGLWNCRVIKLGELVEIIAYRNFQCRVTDLGTGVWELEKLTGSQRSLGLIRSFEGNYIYTGIGFVDGGPALRYDQMPLDLQTPVEPGQTHAVVGVFEMMSADRARLLQPWPILESQFDILYLTR